MANDNNKIKNLVPESDDENLPTLDSTAAAADATGAENSNDPLVAMQADLRISERNVDRLLFDVEQLRARCTGLDKELEAREKLTEKVNSDLRLARSGLDDRDTELSELKKILAAEKNDNQQRQQELSELRSSLETMECRLQQSDSRAQENTSDSTLRQALVEKEHRIAAIEAANQQLSEEIASAHEHHARNQGTRSIADDNHGPLDEENGARDRRVADKEEVRELNDQIARTEEYADSLRVKLKDQIETATESLIARQQLEVSLENALTHSRDLKRELEDERLLEKELLERLDEQEASFEEKMQMMRLELSQAEESVTDQSMINEQLTSDLIDNQGFRQALEEQLSSTARQSESTIRELDRRLRKKLTLNEDIQRKLETKDNAIAALLGELANRGSSSDVAHAAQVDRQKESADKIEPKPAHKVTRLLVGSIDGQEIRYPLFKERLTIGRTAHNDIQLQAQFVSRRHAVIVCDQSATRIVDWGSRNGVTVNNERVNEQFLKNGDTVTIGTTEFKYSERPKR